MSERRCDSPRCKDTQICDCEPQDVAPGNSSGVDRPAVVQIPAGATSCDSAELVALRETVSNCDCMCAEAGQTLAQHAADLDTERDELRAKLAEAERQLERETMDLAKALSDLERSRAFSARLSREHEQEQKRAEAAEARVREQALEINALQNECMVHRMVKR